MDYKRGLKLLKENIQSNTPEMLPEFLTIEERFLKNERDEKLFGSSENTRNTYAQIIYALNELALKSCNVSLNDLSKEIRITRTLDEGKLDRIIGNLRRIEGKIDQGRVEDRETAAQLLDLLSKNQFTLDETYQVMQELQIWAINIQKSGLPASAELQAKLEALATDKLGVDQYFQIAIPIIPGILAYNVELGSQNQLDLKAIWNRMKAKLEPRKKGDGRGTGFANNILGTGRRWAVIVGVNQYDDISHYGQLKVCVKDAWAIYKQLIASGYEQSRIRLITDESSDLPTRDNILVALKSLAEATDPQDILLIYYSGHGDEESGESYLVARSGNRLALEDTSIKISRIKKIMEEAPARAKVIILDACHSGANIQGKGPKYMTSEFIHRVFEQAEGIAILASCKQGQLSYEWLANERSVFTYYLLEALVGKADFDEKGFVTINDANRLVSDGVRLWASQRNYYQTPTLQAEIAGDIILAYVVSDQTE